MRGQRNLAVQGLRGACVLAIFTFHVLHSRLIPEAPEGSWTADLLWLFSGLRFGVEVFFMISGYVIVQSLQRHANVGAFLRDRALRIFPLWLPLAIAMLIAGWFSAQHGGRPPPALEQPALLLPALAIMAPVLPVPTVHPAQWSLNYELWFYAMASLAWWLGQRPGVGRRWRIAGWILPAALFVTLFPRALFFVPGVLVALGEPWLQQRSAWFRYGWLGLPLAWVAWLSTGVDAADLQRTLVDFAREVLGLAVLLAFLGGAAFFAWLIVGRREAGGLLEHPLMQWLGTISYSFYLVHPIAVSAVKRGLLPHLPLEGWGAALALAAFGLPLACLCSWATWALLEVRLRRWLVARQSPLSMKLGESPMGGK